MWEDLGDELCEDLWDLCDDEDDLCDEEEDLCDDDEDEVLCDGGLCDEEVLRDEDIFGDARSGSEDGLLVVDL